MGVKGQKLRNFFLDPGHLPWYHQHCFARGGQNSGTVTIGVCAPGTDSRFPPNIHLTTLSSRTGPRFGCSRLTRASHFGCSWPDTEFPGRELAVVSAPLQRWFAPMENRFRPRLESLERRETPSPIGGSPTDPSEPQPQPAPDPGQTPPPGPVDPLPGS